MHPALCGIFDSLKENLNYSMWSLFCFIYKLKECSFPFFFLSLFFSWYLDLYQLYTSISSVWFKQTRMLKTCSETCINRTQQARVPKFSFCDNLHSDNTSIKRARTPISGHFVAKTCIKLTLQGLFTASRLGSDSLTLFSDVVLKLSRTF